MRKEYDITSSEDLIDKIVEFLISLPIYEIEVPRKRKTYQSDALIKFRNGYEYAVVHNVDKNVYLMFFSFDNKYVHMLASTEYDDTKDIFYQQGIIVKDSIKMAESGILSQDVIERNYYHIIPSLSMYDVNSLVCNYHPEDKMVMLSGIRTKPIEYEWGTDEYVNTITYNMCFGGIKRNQAQTSGFLMGGDFCLTLEVINRSTYFKKANMYSYLYSYVNILPSALEDNINYHFKLIREYVDTINRIWIDYPLEDENTKTFTKIASGKDSLHKFQWFLQTDVDEYGFRDKRWLLGNQESKAVINGDGDTEKNQLPNIPVLPMWATTLNMGNYIPLKVSNSLEEGTLPTYKYLMSRGLTEKGRTVNTLNNISLILPIYFYIKRDPEMANIYSFYGYTDTVNYVNMYNMFTNTLKESNYPIDKAEYNCFQTGRRRQAYGDVGYNGVAFRQE